MIRPAGPVLAVLAAAALSAQAVPGPVTFKLDNGLDCVLLENHERPLIRMELVCRWDRSELPAGKEAIGGFLAELMAAGGAGGYSRAGFNRALDALGMTYSFAARVGQYRWSLTADSRAQETAMELLADAVVRPVFDGPLVESERKADSKRVASRSPRDRAVSRFLWNLGDPAALAPPGATVLERIEFQDLLDFRTRVIRPEASVLALYGDLNPTQARQLALMHLGIWGPAAQGPLKGIAPRPAAKDPVPEPRVLAVFESGPSAEVWAGAPRPGGTGNPAVTALLPILLARAARSRFSPLGMTFRLPQQPGSPLLIQAKVPLADRDALVPGFLAALESLRQTGFSPEDLACALIQWKAENSALALHPEVLVRETTSGRLDPGLAQSVDRLTLKEIDEVLGAWLAPERIRYLLLGADAPMLRAAEAAGLKPSAVIGSDS